MSDLERRDLERRAGAGDQFAERLLIGQIVRGEREGSEALAGQGVGFRYRFRARFSDGRLLEQPADDSSIMRPGEKSAMFDYSELARQVAPTSFSLIGDHVLTAWFPTGELLVNDRTVVPGDELPPELEWVPGDPVQGVYYRRVTKTFGEEVSQGRRSVTSDGRVWSEPGYLVRACVATNIQFCIGLKAEPGVRNFLGVR